VEELKRAGYVVVKWTTAVEQGHYIIKLNCCVMYRHKKRVCLRLTRMHSSVSPQQQIKEMPMNSSSSLIFMTTTKAYLRAIRNEPNGTKRQWPRAKRMHISTSVKFMMITKAYFRATKRQNSGTGKTTDH
jgi:uncharacterized protein involved in high-affinity Fe2+ transport